MNAVKQSPSPNTQCIILCCHAGAIFIRASYGTSHGQNNISMVVTGMWRQDESRIKIKANEYKWHLLHLEGGINHMWANVVCSLSLSLTPFRHITPPLSPSLPLFCCFSFSNSLHLIKLAAKCPSAQGGEVESRGIYSVYCRCQGVTVEKYSRPWHLTYVTWWYGLCSTFSTSPSLCLWATANQMLYK